MSSLLAKLMPAKIKADVAVTSLEELVVRSREIQHRLVSGE